MLRRDRPQVSINLENDRLTAVLADVVGPQVEIRAWLAVDVPAGIDSTDAVAIGKWVGETLRSAGMYRAARAGGVVFAVPRGEVVLKRVAFPPGTSEADLPGMVRLQMVRQLTMSPENAAIDFARISAVPAGPGGCVVLAGALQGDRLDWRRAIARSAGVRLGRVALRSAGGAALLAESSQRRGGATLGIALGSGSTEFIVVEDGQLVFARATDLYRPDSDDDVEAFSQRVAVEAKRTWMSYRGAPESSEIEAVAVLGADDAAKRVAAQCRESLALPSEATDYPEFVRAPSGMSPAERSVMAPLAGLLAEEAIGRDTLNFASPKKSPDTTAIRRQRMLLAALLAVVVGGGLLTTANLAVSRQRARLAELESEFQSLAAEYGESIRTRARVEHLDRWVGSRVDWLAHVGELTSMLPEPRSGVLDRLDCHGDVRVTFTLPSRQKRYAAGAWANEVQAVFDVAGTVKRREVADALRDLLVKNSEYELQTRGPDTPQRFDWSLTTSNPRPRSAEPRATDKGARTRGKAWPRRGGEA
ncbi:MAG: pilus assembly protein PilM [Phycisphaeraceae bacterium]|nr:pilus assembly protein PilM [Phycisphaeraceae bacterium]